MRRWRLAVAAALAPVAVLAILYAHDLRSWQATLHSAEITYAAQDGQTPPTTAPTLLPSSLSGDLLSVRLDQQWLRALPHAIAVYDLLNPVDGYGAGAYRIFGSAERDLTKVTDDPDPAHASQAYDLLAVLYFRSAYPGTGTNPNLLAQAVSDLQNAVRLDPANEIAKENLELAERVITSKAGGHLQQPAAGTGASHRRRGAPSPPPGGGF